MLVTIGVVALLTALIVVSVSTARQRSRQTACAANLQQIGMAHGLYEVDFPDGLYCLTLAKVGCINYAVEKYEERPEFVIDDWSGLWMGQLQPYLKTLALYQCPAADLGRTNWFDAPQLSSPMPLTYAWNMAFFPRHPLADRYKERRELIAHHESDHPLFLDEPFYKFFYRSAHLLSVGFANTSSTSICHRGYCPSNRDKRHPVGSNILSFDGHLEGMDFAAIWKRFNYQGAAKPPNGYVIR